MEIMKNEVNSNVNKIIESNKKHEVTINEKKELELRNQDLEKELHYSQNKLGINHLKSLIAYYSLYKFLNYMFNIVISEESLNKLKITETSLEEANSAKEILTNKLEEHEEILRNLKVKQIVNQVIIYYYYFINKILILNLYY